MKCLAHLHWSPLRAHVVGRWRLRVPFNALSVEPPTLALTLGNELRF